jgi:hypothetical protein
MMSGGGALVGTCDLHIREGQVACQVELARRLVSRDGIVGSMGFMTGMRLPAVRFWERRVYPRANFYTS